MAVIVCHTVPEFCELLASKWLGLMSTAEDSLPEFSGTIDLLQLFGKHEIELYDHFIDGTKLTQFVEAYAFNEMKSVKQKYNGGTCRVWICTGDDCDWMVKACRKRGKKKSAVKTDGIPFGAWYFQDAKLEHRQCCDSTRSVGSKVLGQLIAFQAAIVEGHSVSRKRVISNVLNVHGINLQSKSKKSVIYKTIRRCMDEADSKWESEFQLLPGFLEAFKRVNPKSRVCCQVDTKNLFYRAFLSIGTMVAQQSALLPVLSVDGCHMKTTRYNGVALTLVGRDGNGKNVPLAIAFVHKETIDNFNWFFANCVSGGIDFSSAGFSD